MKRKLRVVLLSTCACFCLAGLTILAQAQKIDFAFGVDSIEAPSASSADSSHSPVSLTGGTYPGFSGDFLFFHNFGVGGELYWKASRGNYGGDSTLPFRPIFWDFNAVYAPKVASHTYLELDAGIGGLSTHFYCSTCNNGLTNYVSDNHFMADFGGGLKLYPGHSGFFIRPEARVYVVNNNLYFSSPVATRFGASIGYTFK